MMKKASSTRNKDTARTATLHKKAKKKVTRKNMAMAAEAGARCVSKGQLVRGTREVHAEKGLSSWMGESMRLKAGQGYVVIQVE